MSDATKPTEGTTPHLDRLGSDPALSAPTAPQPPTTAQSQGHKRFRTQPQNPSAEEPPVERKGTGWFSWLLFLPIVTLLPVYLSKLHYALPEPLPPHDAQGRPQPSEELILSHIGALENIGYRTVGTHEAIAGEQYVLGEVQKLLIQCEEGGVLNCEWWEQKGSGYHAFDIIDHEVLKAYSGITNIILKISAHNPPSYNGSASVQDNKKDAVLLGAHIDSTMPSPGAADDAIGVGVMLDIARVLVERNDPFDGSIIFMWNGAEETLQDGSYHYSTRHHTKDQVRAAINLEAAGTTGGALLFQATSREMIEAYAHAPHPRGTIIAADVFSSGILMSDTDFVQFEKYLGVSGLDMAIVGHSYFYHTRKDSLKYVERGSAQHFANNIQSIVDYLLSPSSPLLKTEKWSPPDMVYFSLFDKVFFHYSMEKADGVYVALAAVALALVVKNLRAKRWKAFVVALVGTPLGMIGGILSANFLAGVLLLSGRGQTWFRHEHLPLVLFMPAGYIGNLTVQLLLSKLLSPTSRAQLESAHYSAQLLFAAGNMLLMQALRIRSAYIFSFILSLLLVGGVGNELGALVSGGRRKEGMGIKMTYLLPMAGCMALAVEAVTTTLDIFTPLAGRMGKDAPAEFIIATISSSCGFIFFPPLIPLFYRLSRKSQRMLVGGVALFMAGVITVLAGPWYWPYDAMHPKRVGVQYLYNHTSNEHTGHVAFMDRGPQDKIVSSIHSEYGLQGSEVEHTALTDADSDWDVLYPISNFIDTYKFPLYVSDESGAFEWPTVGHWMEDVKWEYGERHIRLRFDFRGLVWPTLAFEAEVFRWSFGIPPPEGKRRHHVKVATSFDESVVDLNFTLGMNQGERLKIHWSAVDINQMVPGTASRLGPDMPASKWLLDMDEWAKKKWDDSLEILMTGVVCGVIEL
ncbi:hypothetical protein IAT40_005923 [Kwoniella sp. CBS 6097]